MVRELSQIYEKKLLKLINYVAFDELTIDLDDVKIPNKMKDVDKNEQAIEQDVNNVETFVPINSIVGIDARAIWCSKSYG